MSFDEHDFHKEENDSSKYYIDPPKPTYKKKNNISLFKIILVSLVSALIGGILTAYLAPMYLYGKYIPYPNTENKTTPQNIEIVTKDEKLSVIPTVVKKAMPSVVGITTVTLQRDFLFGVRKGQGVGTGVIVDPRGYILTNSHVVNDGETEEVKVLLDNGKDLKAKVLWNDPLLDLAIVKISEKNLPVAELGNSDEIQVGQLAIAIGNPLGLAFERTVTSGIISGLERRIEINEFQSIEGLIQTDASINPGNSGGPLLDEKGRVVGINTVKIQTGEGLGFAIPINIAKPIVDEFIKRGEFTKVYLGIKGIDVGYYIRNYQNDLGVNQGVIVMEVSPNSPVEVAGIKKGDIILSMNGQKIEGMTQLMRSLYQYRPNDTVKIEVLRNQRNLEFQVTFKATPKTY
ncbi:serine protease HtrA [Inediibacterium massiliense]|uniref:serine protease HtrA n=1 Tax=Inediibacterium massiliense TaxID=1658111 RepID=UPI000AC3AE47|nr:trypsin-like peptidase domain-containing protein [Inediibacterium massiliense]